MTLLQQTSSGEARDPQWALSLSPGGFESEPEWPALRTDVTITYISAALGDWERTQLC